MLCLQSLRKRTEVREVHTMIVTTALVGLTHPWLLERGELAHDLCECGVRRQMLPARGSVHPSIVEREFGANLTGVAEAVGLIASCACSLPGPAALLAGRVQA